jgi:hypothetical protein
VIEKDADDYSTAFTGDLQKVTPATNFINGKDTGWIYYPAVSAPASLSIFCHNSSKLPITIYKQEAGSKTPIADVKFELYKKSGSAYNLVTLPDSVTSLVTDENGEIKINNPFIWKGAYALTDGEYILKEKPIQGYVGYDKDDPSKRLSISFSLKGGTYGTYPVVENGSGKITTVSGSGVQAEADETGLNLYVYNERGTGSITVTKNLADKTENYETAHGKAIFIFEVKQYATTDTDFATPLNTWVQELEFDWEDSDENTVTFTGLPTGYKYRVEEVKSGRYDATSEEPEAISIELDGDERTVAFTNGKTSEAYLTDTAVKTNTFVLKTETETQENPESSLVKVTIKYGKKSQVVDVARDGYLNTASLSSLLNTNELEGLTADKWKIQYVNGPETTFTPSTRITGDCTITVATP